MATRDEYLAQFKDERARDARIMEMYRSGIKKIEIARQLGMTRQRIGAIIKREEKK